MNKLKLFFVLILLSVPIFGVTACGGSSSSDPISDNGGDENIEQNEVISDNITNLNKVLLSTLTLYNGDQESEVVLESQKVEDSPESASIKYYNYNYSKIEESRLNSNGSITTKNTLREIEINIVDTNNDKLLMANYCFALSKITFSSFENSNYAIGINGTFTLDKIEDAGSSSTSDIPEYFKASGTFTLTIDGEAYDAEYYFVNTVSENGSEEHFGYIKVGSLYYSQINSYEIEDEGKKEKPENPIEEIDIDKTFEDLKSQFTNYSLPPLFPSSFKVDDIKGTTITFNWDTVENADSYKLYRSSSHYGDYTLVDTVQATSISDSNLESDSNYFYKISALNTYGESSLSEALQAKTSFADDEVTTINVGETVNGMFTTDNQGGDVYKITLQAGITYTMVGSGKITTSAKLYSEDGVVLQSYHSEGDSSFNIKYTPEEKGIFYIKAWSWLAEYLTTTGSYTLNVYSEGTLLELEGKKLSSGTYKYTSNDAWNFEDMIYTFNADGSCSYKNTENNYEGSGNWNISEGELTVNVTDGTTQIVQTLPYGVYTLDINETEYFVPISYRKVSGSHDVIEGTYELGITTEIYIGGMLQSSEKITATCTWNSDGSWSAVKDVNGETTPYSGTWDPTSVTDIQLVSYDGARYLYLGKTLGILDSGLFERQD